MKEFLKQFSGIFFIFLCFIPNSALGLEAKDLVFYEGNFKFNENTKVYTDERFMELAKYFLSEIDRIADYQDRIVKTNVYKISNESEVKGNVVFVDDDHNIANSIKQKYGIKNQNKNGFWVLITEEFFVVGLTKESYKYLKKTLIEIVLMSKIEIIGRSIYISIPTLKLIDYPNFNFRAVHLTLFDTLDVTKIKKLIDLSSENKFNYIIFVINNGILYDSHPEISKRGAFSKSQIKELIEYAKDKGLKVIPEINLLSHQEWLLSPAYPEFIIKEGILANSPNMFHTYNPKDERIYKIVFDLLEEIIEIFNPSYIHIGHDEAFGLRVYNEPESYILFAEHVKRIHNFLSNRNIITIMWSDMLRKDHNGFQKGLYKAIDIIPKDIIIFNWYFKNNDFSSIDYFAEKGFFVAGSVFKDERIIKNLSKYLRENKNKKIFGMVVTTWYYLPWNKMEMLSRLIEVAGKEFW